jgi:nitrate reductase NapE component
VYSFIGAMNDHLISFFFLPVSLFSLLSLSLVCAN